MKKILTLLLCVLFTPMAAVAENHPVAGDTTFYGEPSRVIWMNIGQLIRKEVMVSYQQAITNRLAIELGMGYKFATGSGQPFTSSSSIYGQPFDYAERMEFSQGLYTDYALKIYLDGGSAQLPEGNYFSGGGFYRYRFYDHQLVNSQTPLAYHSDNYASQQSLDLHIAGVKFLFGGTKVFVPFTANTKLLVDYYTGVGYRWKYAKTAYDWKLSTSQSFQSLPPTSPTPPSDNPTIEKEWARVFSLHAGLKLGILF